MRRKNPRVYHDTPAPTRRYMRVSGPTVASRGTVLLVSEGKSLGAIRGKRGSWTGRDQGIAPLPPLGTPHFPQG
jgi:hypothetical protein